MKTMRYIILMMAAVLVGLTSCSSSSDDSEVTPIQPKGMWYVEYDTPSHEVQVFQFEDDGSGYWAKFPLGAESVSELTLDVAVDEMEGGYTFGHFTSRTTAAGELLLTMGWEMAPEDYPNGAVIGTSNGKLTYTFGNENYVLQLAPENLRQWVEYWDDIWNGGNNPEEETETVTDVTGDLDFSEKGAGEQDKDR